MKNTYTFMKTFSFHSKQCLLLVFMLMSTIVKGQTCNAPSSVTVETVASVCPSSGTVRLNLASYSDIDPKNNINREYAVYHNTLDTLIRPWQNDSLFTSMPYGSYRYAVRDICEDGLSNITYRTFSIANNERNINASAVVLQQSTCNNGVLQINATGNGPFTYALVPNLNSPDLIDESEYIRPKQSSHQFLNMSQGTYYARTYDACGRYVTNQVVFGGVASPNPISISSINLSSCHELRVNVSHNSSLIGYPDSNRKFIVIYPDNSSDTSSEFRSSYIIPREKLIPGSATNRVRYRLIWECGSYEVYRNFSPNLIRSVYLEGSQIASCDSSRYTFVSIVGLQVYYAYTTDGGATWHNKTGRNTSINLKNGIEHTVSFAICGDTISFPLFNASGPFHATVEEGNQNSCEGFSSLIFRGYNTNNLQFESIVAPPGVYINSSISGTNPSWTVSDVPLGYYVFRITNSCGGEVYDTVDVKGFHKSFQMDYSYRFECSNNNIQIYNYTANIGTYYYQLLDMSDIPIRSGSLAPSNTISSSGLLLGNQYKLRVWTSAYPCVINEKIIPMPRTSNTLDLTNNITFNECRNTENTGALIVRPDGGFPPYTYYLYEDTMTIASRIVGPVNSNIFTNLKANKKHIIQVSDQCGRGSNIPLTFGQATLQLLDNAGGVMPCEGDTLSMSLVSQPEFTYQWQKDGLNIQGATTNSYTINDIEEGDNGIYQLSYNVGACQVLTKSFTLATELCDISLLPVELTSFTAKNAQDNVQLNWNTASEKVNSGFEVLHSTDGYQWTKIGFAASKSIDGNSNTPLQYHFLHTQAQSGINYYQLKQIDFDGAFAFSAIIQSEIQNVTPLVKVYPNPATDKIQLSGLPLKNKLLFTNNLGKTVLILENISNQESISIKNLSKGTYSIFIYSENEVPLQSLKLVVL